MIVLLGLCVAQTGMMSMLPIFWTLPTTFLTGAAAAGGVALINSVANIGGFLGASLLGQFGLWSMVVCLITGALLASTIGDKPSPRQPSQNYSISAMSSLVASTF